MTVTWADPVVTWGSSTGQWAGGQDTTPPTETTYTLTVPAAAEIPRYEVQDQARNTMRYRLYRHFRRGYSGGVTLYELADGSVTSTAGALRVYGDENSGGNYEIVVYDPDGLQLRQLTDDPAYDSWWPKPSPDGQTVLFCRTPVGTHDTAFTNLSVWTVSSAGGTATKVMDIAGASGVTSGWTAYAHPEWNPAGTLIAVNVTTATGSAIVTVDTATWSTADIRFAVLTGSGNAVTDPSFSPDGTKIVFAINGSGLGSLWRVDTTGALAAGILSLGEAGTLAFYDPYYSPDGTQIAYLWLKSLVAVVGEWGIRIIPAGGGTRITVIDDNNVNSKPAWSPSGDLIYFMRYIYGSSTAYDLYTIQPIAGANPVAFGPLTAATQEYPLPVTAQVVTTWSPGGSYTVSASERAAIVLAGYGAWVT